MSSQLVQDVLNSYVQEIGTGAGKMLRAWTPVEDELAEYAASLEAENARLAAAHEAAADELARVMQELREARHKLELENQVNGDLFDVIAEIAAMFDIPRSAPYISRETISAVAQMKHQLESADSEIKRLNDELATALNLPF